MNAGDRERTGPNPLIAALARTTTPLVAAVQGRAVGVGSTMLLHCDLVFVAEDARLTTPFVNLALVPEAASSLLLPTRIGHVRAFAMFVLGNAVDAPTAVAWGLANAVVPKAELRARARAAAFAVAAQPALAVAITKRLMRDAGSFVGADRRGEPPLRRAAPIPGSAGSVCRVPRPAPARATTVGRLRREAVALRARNAQPTDLRVSGCPRNLLPFDSRTTNKCEFNG